MQITIEKMIYGGDGLGRLPADEQGRGKAVFVPFVLEAERVEIALREQKAGFARGTVERIEEASANRVLPPCPYFAQCGGCHYQHTGYEHQLEIKAGILRETLSRTAKLTLEAPLEIHKSEPWQYRNRTRMKVRTTPEFALGYYRFGTHELLPVEECPISSPLINQAISAVWEVGKQGVDGSLREVQFFSNHDDSEMLLEFYLDRNGEPEKLRKFAMDVMVALPKIAGVVVLQSVQGSDDETERAPLVSTRTAPAAVIGRDFLRYKVGEHEYRVSGGSFFQTNRFMAEELVATATRDYRGQAALDLYAGTGLFSLPLSKRFVKVTSVESAPYSFADLEKNAPRGTKAVQSTTEDFFKRKILGKYDLVIADPPRAGLGEKVARALGRMNTSRVTYVSCDPATLARDMKILLESGFRVESVHLVDLFPQTFHMESVVHLVR